MKVYLAWDDGDYYGPDFIGCYATLEAAMREVEKVHNHYRKYPPLEWKSDGEDQWSVDYSYHIDAVEPEA